MTFGRPNIEAMRARRADERAANLRALATPTRSLHAGTFEGGTTGGAAKTAPYRDRALLDMASGRHCKLAVPGVCNHDPRPTVACHSNLSIHGKGGARKADDVYAVDGCSACHEWLDRGPAPADAKALAFTLAHIDQVLAWRAVATDPAEPLRFRRAAQRALVQLGAMP